MSANPPLTQVGRCWLVTASTPALDTLPSSSSSSSHNNCDIRLRPGVRDNCNHHDFSPRPFTITKLQRWNAMRRLKRKSRALFQRVKPTRGPGRTIDSTKKPFPFPFPFPYTFYFWFTFFFCLQHSGIYRESGLQHDPQRHETRLVHSPLPLILTNTTQATASERASEF